MKRMNNNEEFVKLISSHNIHQVIYQLTRWWLLVSVASPNDLCSWLAAGRWNTGCQLLRDVEGVWSSGFCLLSVRCEIHWAISKTERSMTSESHIDLHLQFVCSSLHLSPIACAVLLTISRGPYLHSVHGLCILYGAVCCPVHCKFTVYIATFERTTGYITHGEWSMHSGLYIELHNIVYSRVYVFSVSMYQYEGLWMWFETSKKGYAYSRIVAIHL